MGSNRRGELPEVKLIEFPRSGSVVPPDKPDKKVVAIGEALPSQVKEGRYQLVEMFLQARSFPEGTARSYRQRLRTFCDWVGKDWQNVGDGPDPGQNAHIS